MINIECINNIIDYDKININTDDNLMFNLGCHCAQQNDYNNM